jgi:transcriptional regulator with GAF, ATPase, and Fis domain
LTESVSLPTARSLECAKLEAERVTLIAALNEAGWQTNTAAELLGVSRATLYRLVARHAVTVKETRSQEQREGEPVERLHAPSPDRRSH